MSQRPEAVPDTPTSSEPKIRLQSTRVIGPVTFEVLDREGAIGAILCAFRSRSACVFAFCNMHTFNMARRCKPLQRALSKATVFNDGLGIDLASSILFGSKFPDNLNGTDLTPALLASFDQPVSIYLVGSPPGVADQAARAIEAQFPLVSIVGSQHGFFSPAEDERIVDSIRAAGTDLLLLGMGNPRQELWAMEFASRTGAVTLCVGAFFDFISGRISRAPLWVRRLRSEWLYRIAMEPSRLWRRYFGGAVPFLYSVLAEKYARQRRFR
jgi:exopolysaccharide biosynthesis WecB/TagA/CpsF family protein